MSWLVVCTSKQKSFFFFFLIDAELREEQEVEGETGADGIVRIDGWKWENGMKKKFSWIQFIISKTEKGAFKEKDP